MPNPDTPDLKKTLRQQLRKVVVIDPIAASLSIVEKIATMLSQHPEWQAIALFAALPREPDISSLLALFPERAFFYPRVQGNAMTFHRIVDPEKDLIAGPWGLREPVLSLPEIDAHSLDLILCPGMAFTRDGKRLGKGGGYYDRYLDHGNETRPHRVGVTFTEFMLEDLPYETHDIRMHEVVFF